VNDDPDILWNFEKFLIGRDGQVLGRFEPRTAPDDEALVAAIEASLG
jgi:glutathione peroxidase